MSTFAQQMLEKYLQAEMDILDGKNVSFRGETLGMEDLDKIREGRKEWERRANGNGKSYSLATWGN